MTDVDARAQMLKAAADYWVVQLRKQNVHPERIGAFVDSLPTVLKTRLNLKQDAYLYTNAEGKPVEFLAKALKAAGLDEGAIKFEPNTKILVDSLSNNAFKMGAPGETPELLRGAKSAAELDGAGQPWAQRG